jgi:hypothetical protein
VIKQQKRISGSPAAKTKRVHGNTKYPFWELKKRNDFFVIDDVTRRNGLSTCLKNYNTKNGTTIKISTKRTAKGLLVVRVK